jgi:hypothetical protein
MATVITIHKITTSDPNAELIHTGRFDREGNAILKRTAKSIRSGEFFELDDPADLARLLEMGAVRYPTDEELALREQREGR